MLTDPRAVEIISRARQKNVANARVSTADFDQIFADFFDGLQVQGRMLLDIGPGQFDFSRRMRDRGAKIEHVDRDDAVVELGGFLGFSITQTDLEQLDWTAFADRFDGVFCKFSINALWRNAVEQVRADVCGIDGMIRKDGWGWVAPWNGIGKRSIENDSANRLVRAQSREFVRCGWCAFELTEQATARYGLTGAVVNHRLFVKNMPVPDALAGLRVVDPEN